MNNETPARIAPNLFGALQRNNLRHILQILRQHGPQSRASLAKLTGLSSPAVSNLFDELQALGLAQEGARQKTERGQPPIAIELKGDGAFSVGIQLDSQTYRAVIVNFLGEVIHRQSGASPTDPNTDWPQFIADLYFGLSREVGTDRLLGLGLVAPGPFDTVWPGIPTPGAIAQIQSKDIEKSVSKLIGQPVYLENDATAAAYGEKLYGVGSGRRNYFYIYIGQGVGSGIVANGKIYRGDRGNAGEFGHLPVFPDGKPCYCGNVGCIGQYASMNSRTRMLDEARVANQDFTIVANSWLRHAVQALHIGIAIVENMLEPEVIILGGTAPKEILEQLASELQILKPSLRDQIASQRLILSHLSSDGVAIAAAALPILYVTSASNN